MKESRYEWQVPTFLSAFVFAFVLSANPTLDSHEVLVAQTAREMIASGDYIHPTFAGEPRLQKPPLAYWLCAASLLVVRRKSEFAARMPSAIAAVLGVMITSIFARRAFGRGMGFLAGSVQATSIWTISYGRLALVDSVLTTLVSAAMLVACWDRFGKPTDGRPWAWIPTPLFWVLCGLIVLAKGPVGLVMLLPPVIVYRWMRGRRESDSPLLFHPSAILGIALFLVLSLAWPIAMSAALSGSLGVVDGAKSRAFSGTLGTADAAVVVFLRADAVADVSVESRGRSLWRFGGRESIGATRIDCSYCCGSERRSLLCTLSAGKRAHYILPALPAACMLAALAVRESCSSGVRGEPRASAWGVRPRIIERRSFDRVAAPHADARGSPDDLCLLALVETIIFAGVVAPGQDLTGFRQMVERNEELLQRSTVVQVGSRERATVFSINKPLRWLPTPPESIEETMLILLRKSTAGTVGDRPGEGHRQRAGSRSFAFGTVAVAGVCTRRSGAASRLVDRRGHCAFSEAFDSGSTTFA